VRPSLRRALLAALLAAAAAPASAEAATAVSPHGTLSASVTTSRAPELVVRRAGQIVLRARLGRVTDDRRAQTARVRATASRMLGVYSTTAGKRRRHTVNASAVTLRFPGGAKLELAVADDGVAFRQTGFASATVRYLPAAGTTGYLQRLVSHYEGDYVATPLAAARGRVGYPALLADRAGTYTLLTEAGVPYGQPGEHLAARSGVLTTRPPAGQLGPARPGWRVAILGSLADVVASDLPEDFAAPSRIADPSWIRPGRVAWSWWSDSASPRRLADQKDYVDFAARAGFEYVLVDAGWDPAWVPELVHYAAERDVRILLWTDWHALATPEQRRAVFGQWASWGVAGVKADFLQSDSGERMAVMDDIAADAAAHHLLVDFHGCTVPRGLQRTWPNVMTLEGVWGAEHEKGGRTDDPALNVTLAFTRNVIGSMDYTPVTFSASGRVSTAAAQLAQAIVYESGLQHFADAPSAYTSRPAALELLRAVPAAWDDTRLLAGAPRRSVTLARRAGERWFVGSLSATGARIETVPLRFLSPGRAYTARVYSDDGHDGIAVSTQAVTSAGTLTVPVAANGGFSVDLSPKD
jgi:alpha-glucosidase